MPDDTRYRDAEWLREQYWENGLNTYDIADKAGCVESTVRRWMIKHGIERRSASESKFQENQCYRDEEWLREQYWGKQLSITEMSEVADVSRSAIYTWMEEYNIERRSEGGPTQFDKLEDSEWLREQYIDNQLTTVEIAGEIGCTRPTVQRWLENHNISIRPRSETVLSGSEHWNWNGGVGKNYYGPNFEEQRQKALERDDYECRDCGMTNEEHKRQRGQALHIHHIQKFHTFDSYEEANRLENLVTLCQFCHPRWERLSPLQPQTAD